jgi:predicted metal-dependent phosphoesterase TrpH
LPPRDLPSRRSSISSRASRRHSTGSCTRPTIPRFATSSSSSSAWALLVAALAIGAAIDRPVARPPLTIGGYRVLAADFHTHSSTWSDGALTPFGLVLEARRQGLDAIAITGHNEVIDGKVGHWFSRLIGGPTVLVGEEILSEPTYHMIAAGISERVSFRQSAASAIAEIHRQGGIAIAAHPRPELWPAYDATAMQTLDGAEICHPMIYSMPDVQRELIEFAARGRVAAIGSSDFHGIGPMGMCRTFVFARDASEQAILEAVRAHRTVVYGLRDRPFGDPELVRLVEGDTRLRDQAVPDWRGGALAWLNRIAALLGLAGIACTFGNRIT